MSCVTRMWDMTFFHFVCICSHFSFWVYIYCVTTYIVTQDMTFFHFVCDMFIYVHDKCVRHFHTCVTRMGNVMSHIRYMCVTWYSYVCVTWLCMCVWHDFVCVCDMTMYVCVTWLCMCVWHDFVSVCYMTLYVCVTRLCMYVTWLCMCVWHVFLIWGGYD